MARRAVSANAGEIELVDQRTRYGKVFQQPDGKFRAVSSITPQHWDDQGTWVEADDTPVSTDGGKTWTTVSTPYVLAWNAETLTLTYQSKRGGDVRVRLTALNGVPFSGKPSAATFSGQDLVFTVAPQLDIRLRVRTHGVEIYKILNGPLAPTAITWEVVEGDLSNIIFDPLSTSGLDNLNRSLARQTADGLNRVRRIELLHDKSVVDLVANPGKKTYTVTETFTGRTQFIDPITMARSFVSEVEYPVLIDISVTIIADLDDGSSSTVPVWSPAVTSIRSGNAYATTTFGAWRFQTVAVPQGATINSATLTWNQTAHGGSATLTLAGNNVDSAASWANGSANSAATMAATTATASNLTSGANGTVVTTVTSIIQEIVNRAGWASNNNLRLGHSAIASGTGYIYAEDYSAAGTAQATLAITFTAASTGDFSRSGSIAGRPGGIGPRMRRALPQLYPDSPVTPVELTQSPAAPFRPGRGPAGGPMILRRNLPGQPFADTPVIPVELTQSPAAPFRPGRGPGMGPMLLRRNLAWPLPGIPAASTDVTVALTGVEGTGSVGTLGVQHDQALTGNEATGSVGTLTPATSVALTGLAATGSVGTLAPSTTVALTGVAGTGSVGTFTPGTTLGITGLEGTGSIGTLAPSTTVTLTGNEATATIGTLFPSGDVTVALTGVSATLSIGDLTASGADGPVVPDVTNTPGFRRLGRSQLNVEDEAEKLARRIREGTIKPPAVETPKDDSAYFRESARLAQAIATARADAETSRKAIARYTKQQELKRDSAKVEAKLIRAEQALLLARITEETLMEEMEVIDIAYLAVAVLSITLQ